MVINFVIGELAELILMVPERLFTEMKSEESRGNPSD